MTTKQTEPTHEADPAQPMPPDSPAGQTESPSADRFQGANGLPHDPDADAPGDSGDQDIDTAGTDADDLSPTKAMGTGREVPGDTGAADIVGPTGEEMPLQSHDGLEAEERERKGVNER